ncbi:MAG: UTRA domain-containing protein [Bacteroidetes bacterium]|jgi:GntR family transcriptional regulator/GntR family frlABCD operon transcriptional regulator|nr:UTRA domain-containing protein [Bacteroidota bacterium]
MSTTRTIPNYRRVYETIRKHITDGIYQEGNLLPSESELCVIHHVTRPTIRKALDGLVNEGYIKKQQGKGSIVMGVPQGVGILSLGGTTSAIGQQNLKTAIIVKPRIQTWEEAFTFELSDVEKEVGCIYMERLRYVKDEPVFYDITKIPNINMPRFTSRKLENKSLFDQLRKHYHIEIKGGDQKILATGASGKVMEHLQVKEGHPVLKLNRKLETNKLDFFIYSQVYCNTEKYVLYGNF